MRWRVSEMLGYTSRGGFIRLVGGSGGWQFTVRPATTEPVKWVSQIFPTREQAKDAAKELCDEKGW